MNTQLLDYIEMMNIGKCLEDIHIEYIKALVKKRSICSPRK